MKIIEVIEEIDNVFCYDNNLCYTKYNGIYINQNLINYDEDDYVFVSNDNLFLVKKNKKGLYIYKEEKFNLFNEEFTDILFYDHENFILSKINDDFPVITYFKTCNSEFSLEGLNSTIYFNCKHIATYDSLKRKEILNTDYKGNVIEKFVINEGFNIDGKPHLIDNVLFFTAYDEFQKNQLLTALDIETGKIIWQNQYEVTSERQFIQTSAFNEKGQFYYGFYSAYQVFNPKTGELVIEKEIPEIAKHKLEPYVNAIYENKLWFVSGRGLNTKFGCMNTETQQLELLQDFPQEEDEFFDIPVYHEEKLYLRGKHFNNLYVFE